MRARGGLLLGLGVLSLLSACARPGGTVAGAGDAGGAPSTSGSAAETVAPVDAELAACRARVKALEAAPAMPGAPRYDEHRAEFLGRARGEPAVFVREPEPTADAALTPAALASRRRFETRPPGTRVLELRSRHKNDPETLRALVLREGYAYAPEPLDALAIASHITLPELFREPRIVLQRGAETRWLRRETKKTETTYRYEDGPLAGRAADLLFGDRVAVDTKGLEAPLHRDLRALAEREGFDRTSIERRTDKGLLASLRFGDHSVHAVLESTGSQVSLTCIAEERPVRDAVAATQKQLAPHLRALAGLRETVTEEVKEALRFDRPEGETTADRDGQLRPFWASAYLRGQRAFDFEGTSFPVFGPEGRPAPPEVCVDFVLDSFERTSGTWFKDLGEAPRRVKGRLDFNDDAIPNRRAVLAFGSFAEHRPDLFEVIRFKGEERILFRDRTRYFDALVARADDVRPGDVVAIQGKKADGNIHQHAILVEWSDPITGFPAGLADQMKRPRRRTWEGIMAEAPLRALLYRARPQEAVFAKMDPG